MSIVFNVIDKMDSPRFIKHIRRKTKLHKIKPVIGLDIIQDVDENIQQRAHGELDLIKETRTRYYCIPCNVYLKPSKIEAHRKL